MPIQVDGDPTETREVSNFKDLPRIETNFIRGGMCLVFAEGLAQKAAKIVRMIKNAKGKGFILSDWDFLDRYFGSKFSNKINTYRKAYKDKNNA
jgi:DNA polymerase II large subunit